MIEAKTLSFTYGGASAPALCGLSFCAKAGRVTGVLGPNGSGKSTLFSLLCGLKKPDAGEALLFGKNLSALSVRQRAKTLAFVPQRSGMEFDFTVLDVVLMGRQPYRRRFSSDPAEDGDIARWAMEQTGVLGFSGRPVTGLSGGEWQRVLIARALAQKTPALLLDEPVTGLDVRHQLSVLEIARRMAKDEGKTVLCVLHDLNLAAHYCDELLLLKNGKKVAFGTPKEVLSRAAEVYETPLLWETHPQSGDPYFLPDYEALAREASEPGGGENPEG